MKKALYKALCIMLVMLTAGLTVTPAFAASNTPKKMAVASVKVVDITGIKVNWKSRKKVTGYQIMYTNTSKKKAKKVKVKGYKKKTYTIKNLPQNTKYSIKIRAYKTVKKGKKTKTYYGKWSKVKKLRTEKYEWKYLIWDKLRVDDKHSIMQIKNPSTNKWEGRYGDFNSWKKGVYKGTLYAYGLKELYDYVERHKPVNKYAAMFYASYYMNCKFSYSTDLKSSNWRTKFGTSDVGYHRTNHGASLIEDLAAVCANWAAFGRDFAYLYGVKARIGSNSTHAWTQIQNDSGKWVNWDLCVFSFGSYVANPLLSTLDMDMIREKSTSLNIELDALYDAVYQLHEDNNINDFIDSSSFNQEWINDVPVITDVVCEQSNNAYSFKVYSTTKLDSQSHGLSQSLIVGDVNGLCETAHVPNEYNHRFGDETTWWQTFKTGIQYKIIDAATNKVVESDNNLDVNGTYIVQVRKIEVWKRQYAKLGAKKQYLNICTPWSAPVTVRVADLVNPTPTDTGNTSNTDTHENPDDPQDPESHKHTDN
ncbi:MAG: fibronectin type III domain-containing protein [Eubacterium sp.]|nr:fibronectin type III domain-containing protein [Eubacterium sp.]